MSEIVEVLGVTSSIIMPIANTLISVGKELLMNEEIIGICGLLFAVRKVSNWIKRKTELGAYDEIARLNAEKRLIDAKYSNEIPTDQADPLMNSITQKFEAEGTKLLDSLLGDEEL